MATSTSAAPYDSSTSAHFQAWAGNFAAALSSGGFTATSDTGQITPSTFTVPGSLSTNQVFGYQIWKFADTLQSTVPFFFKVEYGIGLIVGSGPLYQPCIWLTFCTGTDGAGTPQGNVSKRFALVNRQNPTASNQTSYFSYAGNGSRFQAALFDGPSFSDPLIISFERSKDSTGADNSDGLIIFLGCSQPSTNLTNVGVVGCVLAQLLPGSTSIPVLQPQPYLSIPVNYAQQASSYNGVVNAQSPIPFNGCAYNYGLGALAFQGSDFGPGSVNALTVYGASHSYRAPLANLIPWLPGANLSNASAYDAGPTSVAPYAGTSSAFDLRPQLMLRYE